MGTEHVFPKMSYSARYPSRATTLNLPYMEGRTPEDLRELIAALMVHHLRQSGKPDTVSRETEASSPANRRW